MSRNASEPDIDSSDDEDDELVERICACVVGDILPDLAKLLIQTSRRTQLVVTTHSEILVDALSEQPESVVVCEKDKGGTSLKRLDAGELKKWLEEYSLGQLWRKGTLGANRW